ncbi:MAG TPA: HD domain-containing protein [Steroidobacteraceae bacterium]|nr:HD domain-containing protein [Steroidobacteraceae bacterium]
MTANTKEQLQSPQDRGVDLAGNRRSDFDITNTVRVSSPHEVLRATEQLLVSAWPQITLAPVERAFADFDALFAGRMPGYAGVDTIYHDRQHTLDVTLAMARLLAGHERQVDESTQLGSERCVLGVVLALFHDVGYLRRTSDREQTNGAEFTRSHVSRGAEFLQHYLPQLGLGAWAEIAAQIIHFTGYERPFSQIVTHDARDARLGHLLGTADMMAQLADRCYLEKCRDRLYPEFVLGGVALSAGGHGPEVKYASGLDLLRQTPSFVANTRATRLERDFDRAYRFFEVLFEGRNPYVESIDRNMQYLEQVLRSESWRMLRRNPPLHAADPQTLGRVRSLMLGYFKKAWLQD